MYFYKSVCGFRRNTGQCSGLQERHGPLARGPDSEFNFLCSGGKYCQYNIFGLKAVWKLLLTLSLWFISPEYNEQDSHHQCALRCHEGLSSILGAASSCQQRLVWHH